MPEAGRVGADVRGWGRAVGRNLAFRDQLGTDDGHLARRVDAQPNLSSLHSDDRDADVITDEQFFHQLPGEHEHRSLPDQCPEVRLFAQV
jgi:hypothetical protein